MPASSSALTGTAISAAAVGVEVEPALATQLVADVLDQPAALPLLQFTLTELFERLAYYAELFGLGSASGIDLPGEAAGLVPTPKWKRVNYAETRVTVPPEHPEPPGLVSRYLVR